MTAPKKGARKPAAAKGGAKQAGATAGGPDPKAPRLRPTETHDVAVVDPATRDPLVLAATARPHVLGPQRKARQALAAALRRAFAVVTSEAAAGEADGPVDADSGLALARLEAFCQVPNEPRVGVERRLLRAFFAAGTITGLTADPAYWWHLVLYHGLRSALDVAADLLEKQDDLTTNPSSTYNALADAVARGIKRGLLLDELKRTDWNLRFTAERLRMSSAANVLRAIREDPALAQAYEEAKRAGRVKAGGRRKRTLLVPR